MFIRLFFLGFGSSSSSWEKSLLSDSSTTTYHQFQDQDQDQNQNLDFAQAKKILGFIKIQSSDDSDNSRKSSEPHTTPYRITPDNEAVTPEKIRLAVQELEQKLEKAKHSPDASQSIALQLLAAEIFSYDGRRDLGESTKEKLRILSEDLLLKDLLIIKRGAISQSTVKNCGLDLQLKVIKDSLNSKNPEVRQAACTKLEGIISSFEIVKLPAEWIELVTHSIYQAYLQKKYPPHAASSQSKIARRDQEEPTAASCTGKEPTRKKQAQETVISIPAIEGLELSPEDEIRQEWAEATKDLKLNKKDLDDDDLEISQGRINADYQCRLGELFENLDQAEDAKREYQKAVLELWNIEVRHPDIQWKKHPATLKKNKTFLSIYKKTVEKCRKKQKQYFVPPYYTFSGACDGLIEARYRMDLEDYDETASYLQFFEDRKPDWHKIDSSKYPKKYKKGGVTDSPCELSNHQAYYNEILQELRGNQGVQKAYEALKAQNRQDFWTLGVGGFVGMAAFSASFILLMNYFLPKDPEATDSSALTNSFEGSVNNITESFLPDSNFSNFLQNVITNATFIPSAQPQNVNYSDNASTTMAPFAFSSTLAPAVQGCTDLAKCMLSNISFIASLNEYLLDPSCDSTPAQFLHNLTCALIGKYYQYTQAVNMMCVLVKLQEWDWVGVCAPTLPEDQDSIQLGTTCLEPGPIAPVRRSSINLEIHRQRFDRFSKGSCSTKRQANPFVPTESRELTMSDELTDTRSKELSPGKSGSFSDTAASGTRDDSASRSQTLLRKKKTPTITEPPALSTSLSPSSSPERTSSRSLSLSRSLCIPGNCTLLAEYLAANATAAGLIGTNFPCFGVVANNSIDSGVFQPQNTRLDLRNQNIGFAGAMAIAPALQQIPQLQTLVLYGNNMGINGVTTIAIALECLRHLKYIHMDSNNMDDLGAIALASVFKNMPLLQYVILRNNGIENDGAMALCTSLQYHVALSQLAISGNSFNATTAAICKQLLPGITDL